MGWFLSSWIDIWNSVGRMKCVWNSFSARKWYFAMTYGREEGCTIAVVS